MPKLEEKKTLPLTLAGNDLATLRTSKASRHDLRDMAVWRKSWAAIDVLKFASYPLTSKCTRRLLGCH